MSYKRNYKTQAMKLLTLAALAITGFFSTSAFAEKVVFEDVSFLTGTNGKSNTFTINDSGKYQATLVDFDFPSTFNNLEMNIIDEGTFKEVERMNSPGSFVFDATPGIYFANVWGDADASHNNISLYGLKIARLSVSSVPLPASIVLFMSGLLLYVGFGNAGARLSPTTQNELIKELVTA